MKKTGRELIIGGEINWTVFPSIGLELRDVSLGDLSGIGGQPMLDIGKAGVSVKLMPLFKRKIEVDEVNLSDMNMHLPGFADEQNNSASTSPASSMDIGDFEAAGIEISNANITIRKSDQTTEIKQPDSGTSGFELAGPFDLSGSFSIKIPEQQLAGEVEFGGLVQSVARGTHFGIEGFKLSFDGHQGAGEELIPLELTVSANADVDLTNDQATLSDFVLQLYDLSVSGELNVTSLSGDPKLEGQLKLAEFNPKSLLKDLGLEVPLTKDESALTRLQADMNFAGSNDIANMRNLTVKFDKSIFTGNLKVENFVYPRLTFDFQVDNLNVDDYLPEYDVQTGSGTGGDTDETDLTVDVFRGFTGGGDFRIGELVVAGLKATDVSLTMNSDGNGIRFFPVDARFYGGRHEGEIKIDASGDRPILMVNQGLMGVQAGDLLQDLTGSARLQGIGDFFLQVRSDISNSSSVLQTLSGDIGMSVLDGAIKGIDVADTIGMVKSALGKQKEAVGKGGQDQKTEFAELSMTGVFTRGILRSSDLLMQSTLLRATGEGSFNLVEESIDYVLKPVLLGDQVDQSLAVLSDTPIPIKLTGNLYEPDIKVDIVAAIAGSQSKVINQKKDEIIGKLLGGKDDSGAAEEDGDASGKDDLVNSLLDGVFGSKKDKKKKKDDGGDGGAH